MKTLRCLLLPAALASGCGGDAAPAPAPGRPVTVFVLEETSPPLDRGIVGLVDPFRQEEIGFEVAGRIESTLLLGMDVHGPTLDDEGRLVEGAAGAVLAALDTTRYRQALDSARLATRTAQKQLEALEVEARQLIPAEIARAETQRAAAEQEVAAARSAFELASAELERSRTLLAGETISQSEFDSAKNRHDEAQASLEAARQNVQGYDAAVASARASLHLKEVQIEQMQAELEELGAAEVRAAQDLDDCVLRAPFAGRITAEHLGRGAFAAAGQPVSTLTMMDPIKVSVTVSSEQSRRLPPGGQARILAPEIEELAGRPWLDGMVLRKAEVADPATRTFRIDLIVRNVLRRAPQGAAPANLLPVYRDGEALFVPSTTIAADGASVLRAAGYRFGAGAAPGGAPDLSRPLATERVPVVLEDERLTVLHFTFRKIAPGSPLAEFDMLVERPQAEHEGMISFAYRDWVLRPGDLVRVSFAGIAGKRGFYVPAEAVRTQNGEAALFVVEGERCARVAVELHEASGGRRRVTAERLAAGARVVVDGVHYLADGDTVRVVDAAPWQTAASPRPGDAR